MLGSIGDTFIEHMINTLFRVFSQMDSSSQISKKRLLMQPHIHTSIPFFLHAFTNRGSNIVSDCLT